MPHSNDYKRSDRVGELVKHEISDILRKEAKDPGIGGVTITKVRVSDDLRHAQVFFGVLDRTAQIQEIEDGLRRAAGYIHRLLGKRLQLKHVPRPTFIYDRNIDYSFRISELLREIDEEGS